jgi:XRE family transcriptional regulator, master regulator for biofilm formation
MIGDIIKKNRLEKNLSLTKLAELAGISKAYLFNLENNNQKNPSLDIAQKIAKVLEIDLFLPLSEDVPVDEDKDSEGKNLNQKELYFELQKEIEELHSDKLEELKNFIEFTLWKRVKTNRELKKDYRFRLID